MFSQEKSDLIPVADLHCDLLAYLAEDSTRTCNDPQIRCSYPKLKEGGVTLQTLAIYTKTANDSVALAEKQAQIFQGLPEDKFLHVMAAMENASGLCDEEEKLDLGFERLDHFQQTVGPLLYISLTWHGENRFGGGNLSSVGLKQDGELLLEYLNNKQTAIDLSHTSDLLAHDILNYIDKKGLKIIPIASHSNFRAVVDQKRNLPDDLAQEIFRRGGVIGLNVVRDFFGGHPEDHIAHAVALGGENHLCFGADFFHDGDFPDSMCDQKPFSDPRFQDSSCYPTLLELCSGKLSKEKIANQNFSRFLERLRGDSSR